MRRSALTPDKVVSRCVVPALPRAFLIFAFSLMRLQKTADDPIKVSRTLRAVRLRTPGAISVMRGSGKMRRLSEILDQQVGQHTNLLSGMLT